MLTELISLVKNLGRPRVLVVGDLMLHKTGKECLGAAGKVAVLLHALDARVTLAGRVDAVEDGPRIRCLMNELNIDCDGISAEKNLTQFEGFLGARLRKTDIVLASDHGAGACTPAVLARLINNCRALGVRIIANVQRDHDYRKYHGCAALISDRLQAGLATGRTLITWTQIQNAAIHLREKLNLEASIITLDKDGLYMSRPPGHLKHLPARGQAPDVTAAGNMVLSVMGMALAGGADYETALVLANIAAELQGDKVGPAIITRDELLRGVLRHGSTTGGTVARAA